MTRLSVISRAAACLLLGAAAPAPVALVIGVSDPGSDAALSACAASAGLVARKLEATGYHVTALNDPTNGAMGGALTAFTSSVAAEPDAPALLYVCARASAIGTRDFVLPRIEGRIAQTDVLADGIPLTVFAAALRPARQGMLALDLLPAPGLAPPRGMLDPASLGPGEGAAIALDTGPPSLATPMATAIAQGAARGAAGLATALQAVSPPLATLHVPPAPAPAPAPQAPAAAPAPAPAPAAAPANPEEARRRAQVALATLGYYDGRIDGVFGPDTHAAIRRYQHEIGAPMTGDLTEGQMARLLATR